MMRVACGELLDEVDTVSLTRSTVLFYSSGRPQRNDKKI